MRRLTINTVALALAMTGCGGGVETSGSGATTTGGGGAGGETTTTHSSLGGTGGETTSSATGGTGGAPCVIPGSVPCADVSIPPDAYPNELASFVDSNPIAGTIGPIPGTAEIGGAWGASRLGPWATDRDFSGFSVLMYDGAPLPDPFRIAAWTEPQCGLPSDDPKDHEQDVALADVAQDMTPDGVRVTVTTPIHVAAGESPYLATALWAFSTQMLDVVPNGDAAPRALWFGVVDDDCDGVTDPALGWAYLDGPTAPSVLPYHYDLPFMLIP